MDAQDARSDYFRYRTPWMGPVSYYILVIGFAIGIAVGALAGFYGGWTTSAVTGPFKGVPGSQGW